MKVYTFEPENGEFYEFYSLAKAKKAAIDIARERNVIIYVTGLNTTTYKQDWYTIYPNGRFVVFGKGLSFNN